MMFLLQKGQIVFRDAAGFSTDYQNITIFKIFLSIAINTIKKAVIKNNDNIIRIRQKTNLNGCQWNN